MRLFRKFTLLIFLTLLFALFSVQKVFGLPQFSTDYVVIYDVSNDGLTHVTFDISQKNNLSAVYATSFSLSVSQTSIDNIRVHDAVAILVPDVTKTNNLTNITFNFADKVVGKDKVNHFIIEYDTKDVVTSQGSIWEINIPKIEANENTNSQSIVLNVPPQFPTPAYIDPQPSAINGRQYIFNNAVQGNKAISAVFGTTQFYRLKLHYSLSNPLNSPLSTQIALPPDTSYQQIFIEKLSPESHDLKVDPDGNWLASYQIEPNKSLDINAQIVVKLNFTPHPLTIIDPSIYTRPTKIWNFEDPDIAAKALGLSTPKSVYDFVTQYLHYDYSLINGSTVRRGAIFAVENPDKAICTEFTDLFVAIARKNNIPSRELEGYAISGNDKLRPTSLSKDVLHAWPEYYDSSKKTWIQIDPTWANTTGGIDYFNKLDLNHIVFAIHGINPIEPLPAGAYKTNQSGLKDVIVEVIKPVDIPQADLNIKYRDQDANRIYLNADNPNGLSGNAKISVGKTPYTKDVQTDLTLAPFSSTSLEVPLINRPWLHQEAVPIIININGKPVTLIIVIEPGINRFIPIGAAAFLTVCIAFIAWRLHFFRRKAKTSIHW